MVAAQGVDLMRISPDDYRDKVALRSMREKIEKVKKATDLLLWTRFHVVHPTLPKESPEQRSDHFTIAEAIDFLKMFEGYIDIAVFRLAGMMYSHPDGYCQKEGEPYILSCSRAIKESGVKTVLAPNGGFQDLDENEAAIADGKCDMITMSRPWHVDYEYGQKAYEGRGEDVAPCVMCNRCHGSTGGPWYARCTANPSLGLESTMTVFGAPTALKKVAVIGGGPAGMKAAITAAERGHQVTLYEKDQALGGLIRFSDHSKWRWNMKVFKDYLIHQVNKAGVEVKLNASATFEMVKAEGFDTVLVATGAEVVRSRMKGADAANVFDILTCYSNKKALGKHVVMVGAGKIGTEAAIGIVKDGHRVTVLAPGDEMIDVADAGPHNVGNQERIYKNHPDFSYHMKTMVKRIDGKEVVYTDAEGKEKSIRADSIVIWSGLRPRMDEAERFVGSADEVLLLGDCTGRCGRIQKTIRNAFFVASQV
jgi:thioredoxin reductase